MTELLTAAQMRAIEQAAITSGEVTGLELMERAGRGVVEAIFAEWPQMRATSHRAVVLCGPGNNGGDGFVVARLLTEWGWEVEVFLYGEPAKLPPDARVNCERWGAFAAISDLRKGFRPKVPPDILVDALFGTGLTRRPQDDLSETLKELNDCAEVFASGRRNAGDMRFIPVVAVDVPSGLCSDSGRSLGPEPLHGKSVARANLTVSFHRPKLGLLLGDGPRLCGNLRIADIGLTSDVGVAWSDEGSAQRLFKITDHKYTHGHALILSGGPGKGGAARLAARGALRIGAGLVTVGCPPEALAENAARLDAVMLMPVVDEVALAAVLKDARINALCLGPGMGISDEGRNLLVTALKSGRAVVLDADALTLIAREPALFALLHAGCVLTPHGGEFARLFPDIAKKLAAPVTKGPAYSKVDATCEAASRAGCVVLYKGPDTVIADPQGRCSINSAHNKRAAPWLATAGSGDVLAGFITGLMARGFVPMEAAETSAWLHVECARAFGPGLIAEDLPEQLPSVFRALGL
jgi:ADP-dependent NAD(P)H-hydrate dehydratase / NAD(P)H-hydrate epimerase